MVALEPPDSPDSLNRFLVADMTTERVGGIRRIHDHPALADDLCRLVNQTALRIVRMDAKELAHGSAVTENAAF